LIKNKKSDFLTNESFIQGQKEFPGTLRILFRELYTFLAAVRNTRSNKNGLSLHPRVYYLPAVVVVVADLPAFTLSARTKTQRCKQESETTFFIHRFFLI